MDKHVGYANINKMEIYRKFYLFLLVLYTAATIATFFAWMFYVDFKPLHAPNPGFLMLIMPIAFGTVFSFVAKNFTIIVSMIIGLVILFNSYIGFYDEFFIENSTYIPFLLLFINSTLISTILTSISKNIKLFLYNACTGYKYENNNHAYNDLILETYRNTYKKYTRIKSGDDEYCSSIDDIFSGNYKGCDFKLIECSVGYSTESSARIVFSGTVLIAELPTDYASVINLDKKIFSKLETEELDTFFPDESNVNKVLTLALSPNGIEKLTRFFADFKEPNNNINEMLPDKTKIIIENNKLYYWKSISGSKFEINIFKSICENYKETDKITNEINSQLKVIDFLVNPENLEKIKTIQDISLQ